MTVITNERIINGRHFSFKLPIGRIIALEREAGKPLAQMKGTSMEDLSLLVKYAIRENDVYLTAQEFEALLDELTVDDFTEAVKAVSEILNPTKEEAKN
jgi:hypothetical protein